MWNGHIEQQYDQAVLCDLPLHHEFYASSSSVPFGRIFCQNYVGFTERGSIQESQDPLNVSILDGDDLNVRFRFGSAPLDSSDLAGGGRFEPNF